MGNKAFLPVALVATPTRRGCHLISGVQIHYEIGNSRFTSAMITPVAVSTSNLDCYLSASE
jgi:hypothetical protein